MVPRENLGRGEVPGGFSPDMKQRRGTFAAPVADRFDKPPNLRDEYLWCLPHGSWGEPRTFKNETKAGHLGARRTEVKHVTVGALAPLLAPAKNYCFVNTRRPETRAVVRKDL